MRAQILKKMRDEQKELEKIANQERESARIKTLKVELSGGKTLVGYDHETKLQTKLLEMQLEVNESYIWERANINRNPFCRS